MSDAAVSGPVCTICLTAIEEGGDPVACPGCAAVYHADCWSENGGCGVYGCAQAPPVEPRSAMEIPPGFWGQQKKSCPACHAEIAAAAVRCRQCGMTFASATPVDAQTFHQKTKIVAEMPSARRQVIFIFVLCTVTCTAPLGVIYGAIWWSSHRAVLRALPPLYGAMGKIGFGVGVTQILAILVFCALHALKQNP